MKMSNSTYDKLKFVAWVWAPVITLITALINVWFFDCKHFEQIISTLVAIDGFMGSIIAYSNVEYNESKERGNDNE